MGIFILQELLNRPGAFKMPPQPNRRDSPPGTVYSRGIGRIASSQEFDEANSQVGAAADAQLAMHVASTCILGG